jgi:hypothetical protein
MIRLDFRFAASGHEAIDQESTLRGAFFMRGVFLSQM